MSVFCIVENEYLKASEKVGEIFTAYDKKRILHTNQKSTKKQTFQMPDEQRQFTKEMQLYLQNYVQPH